MLNHDCRPNARVFFDNDLNFNLRSKRVIEKGEEVTITYCSLLLNNLERRSKLLKTKGQSWAFTALHHRINAYYSVLSTVSSTADFA